MQVAVKSFNTIGASAAVEAEFLREVQIAQLASATCQRVCRLLGCCKLEGRVCLVMSLYTSSAASLLSSSQGDPKLVFAVKCQPAEQCFASCS